MDKYFSIVFVIGSCLAALGGVLYAPITSVHPYMGMMVSLGVMWVLTEIWGPAAETMVFVVMGIVLIFKPVEV